MNRIVSSKREGRIFVTDELIKQYIVNKFSGDLKIHKIVINSIDISRFDVDIFTTSKSGDIKNRYQETKHLQDKIQSSLSFDIGIEPISVNLVIKY